MKRIINGKRYNTNTATRLHEYQSPYAHNDFNFFRESLYRTEKENYFLAGEGGALTRYGQAEGGGGMQGGEGIRPITKKEAMKWLEEHDGETVLEEEFGDAIKDA